MRSVTSLGLLLVWAAAAVFAAPEADLWPRWQEHDPSSRQVIDHSRWDGFLSRYLVTDHPSGVNLVPYAEVSAEDRSTLDGYLADLQDVAVSTLNRDEQMAYWINLYNAYTVKLILDNYPVSSILKINPQGGLAGLLPTGPWDAEVIRIEGQDLTLNDVEHRILRPIWQDNRIHYAVNCASIGCPNLQPVAFTSDNLEDLLSSGAREYVNHPRGARFDGNRLQLSSIFKWYREDFGSNEQEMLDDIARWAEPDLANRLRAHNGRIRYEYDWDLNDAS